MASVEHKVAAISQPGHELNVRAESVQPSSSADMRWTGRHFNFVPILCCKSRKSNDAENLAKADF
jgi:hypothetical protein